MIINLIDQKGAEGRLEQQLKAIWNTVRDQDVFYEPFDFHHECRKMRWDRLSILMDRLNQYQEQFSYFLATKERSVLSKQVDIVKYGVIHKIWTLLYSMIMATFLITL